MDDCKPIKTPMPTNGHLDLDEGGKSVDQTLYRSMIGSLLYLTASRPDIMFSVCMCARFQANPKESHLSAAKQILRYLKHTPSIGLWYLSGTMIRGTLTRGLNHLQNAKHVLSDRAHEGLQSPSDPKERKGLKKAQYASHLHSTAHSKPPSNPRSDLRFTRGLPAETLDSAPQLRFTRG